MKKHIRQIRKFIYEKLLNRWGLKSKVQQISTTLSEIYEFNISIKHPQHIDSHTIRQIIIDYPYTISTRPVLIKKTQLEDGSFEVNVSFTVLNELHGKKIEKSVREMYLSDKEEK